MNTLHDALRGRLLTIDAHKREQIGVALRDFATRLDAAALRALGEMSVYDDLTDEEYRQLRDQVAAGLVGLAEEIEGYP